MEEVDGRWGKRFSQQFLTDKAERHIFNALQVHSQPNEDSSPPLHFHLRSFSKPLLLPTPVSPRQHNNPTKRLPPILRYLSQKFAKQAEDKKEEKNTDTFKIYTHSLRRLSPFNTDRPLRKLNINGHNKHRTSQEIMALKLQNRKEKVVAKQVKQAVKPVPLEQTQGRGERLSGWRIIEEGEDAM